MRELFQFTREPEKELNDIYTDEYGVIYSWDKERLLKAPDRFNVSSYAIPEGTLFVSDYAFKNSRFKSVSMPQSLLAIGYQSFYGCINLQTIKFPDNLVCCDTSAFARCQSLTRITFSSSIKYIGPNIFSDCSSLESIVIPDNIEEIGGCAFRDCIALKSIKLPQNLKVIENNLFYHCNALETIILPPNLERIVYRAFEFCKSLREIVFPDSLRLIEREAFYGCESLQSIRLPFNLKTLHDNVFSRCINLKDLYINLSNTKTCGNFAANCTQLNIHDLSNNIQINLVIKDGVLISTSDVEVSELPNTISSIGPFALAGKRIPDNFVIPESVIEIQNNAFQGCNMNEITIPASVRIIGDRAFGGCPNLKKVIIKGYPYVKFHAFEYCRELTTFIFEKGARCIGHNVWYEDYNLKEIIDLSTDQKIKTYWLKNSPFSNLVKNTLV